MRDWRRSKLGRPSGVEGHHLTVQHGPPGAQGHRHLPDLGVAGREVAAPAAGELQVPGVAEGGGADAVPFDLEGPTLLVAGQRPQAREHGRHPLGHGLDPRRGRVHPVDHPVLALGAEQHVAALDALAVAGARSPRRRGTSRPRRCRCPRSPSCPPRRSRPGSPRGSPGTPAGGPRCAPPGGSRRGARAPPWAGPRRPARPRAPAADPSADATRGAPGSRTGAPSSDGLRRPRRARACVADRACAGRSRGGPAPL